MELDYFKYVLAELKNIKSFTCSSRLVTGIYEDGRFQIVHFEGSKCKCIEMNGNVNRLLAFFSFILQTSWNDMQKVSTSSHYSWQQNEEKQCKKTVKLSKNIFFISQVHAWKNANETLFFSISLMYNSNVCGRWFGLYCSVALLLSIHANRAQSHLWLLHELLTSKTQIFKYAIGC